MHTTCVCNPLNHTGRLTSIILPWHILLFSAKNNSQLRNVCVTYC